MFVALQEICAYRKQRIGMLSKNKLKYLRQLAQKKHRDAEGVFLAEGPKVVEDLLPHFDCRLLCATKAYLQRMPSIKAGELLEVTQRELEQASQLKTPREVLAVFGQPKPMSGTTLSDVARKELVLMLDGVQDPGNVGTIVRIADWFGIEHVFCSEDTADVFAPKTVQATMGAVGRVKVTYGNLPEMLDALPETIAVYGTFLDGENLYERPLSSNGVIVMGSEGQGISDAVSERVNRRLLIPNFPPDRPTGDSLNVAVATAVTCAEFRRRTSG